jgi:hypothetical protein
VSNGFAFWEKNDKIAVKGFPTSGWIWLYGYSTNAWLLFLAVDVRF